MFNKGLLMTGLLAVAVCATSSWAYFVNPNLEELASGVNVNSNRITSPVLTYRVENGYQYITRLTPSAGGMVLVQRYRLALSTNQGLFGDVAFVSDPVSILPPACLSAQQAGLPLEDELSCRAVSGSWKSDVQECSCR